MTVQYPQTSPFSLAILTDPVWSQVYPYLTLYALYGDLYNTAQAVNVEHDAFDLTTGKPIANITPAGDGKHLWISQEDNRIFNPTGRMGNAGWYDAGAATDYDTPGVDTDKYTAYGAPNFGDGEHDAYGSMAGAYWTLAPALSWAGDLSEQFDVVAGESVCLALESLWSGRTAGTCHAAVVCYDNANKLTGVICTITVDATETGWTLHAATGVVPATSTYARVIKYCAATANGGTFRVRKMKANQGDKPRIYADDRSRQYLRAVYYQTGDANLGASAWTILNYDQVLVDSPGTNRVTTGGAWKFTADRYMHVSIKTVIGFQDANPKVLAANNILQAWLYVNNVSRFAIGRIELLTTPSNNSHTFTISGVIDYELQKGDYLDIRVYQDGSNTITNYGSHISISEIS